MEPEFLTVEEVRIIHGHQIRKYGGTSEIRDINILDSAVNAPRASFNGAFLLEGIPEIAAAYLYYIVSGHPFVDGNKRTGAVAAMFFLELNGWTLDANEDQYEAIVMAVARGEVSREAVAAFFMKNAAPRG